ncbi:major facilitator superfamily domain-containing protein [Dactylonectria macrodidyma]|uniref:Major facilitator superfamily domain-containing protein n=1 Tax=Dactylonectria macrodidyma TaxID=307937 RepID=A0A9P9IL03_9HYPO|nr:major facilitator superfamily domain-containing protein [Dactylonectria macrodidyma]
MTDVEGIKPAVQHSETGQMDKPGDSTITVSKKMEAHVRKKIDRHMLPLVCVLYILSYLDRGNIGNAKTAGAQDDLGLSDSQWAWVLNSFYICYTLFEWTTLLWKLLPAHIYISALCVLRRYLYRNRQEYGRLCACRAVLGILEAAFSAGAPYYLSLFYQRRELGLRVSILIGMSPLANCFAASLAYGISQATASVEPWRLILLIEGAPTIIVAPFVYLFLPDSPQAAKFLSDEEKEASVARLGTRDTTAKTRLNWKQVTAGLGDYQPYVHALIHFCCNYSFAGLANFLLTIVQNLGYSSIKAQGLTAPPYAAAFCLCIAAAFFSDRFGHRGFVIAGCSAMGGVGYLLLATIEESEKSNVRYLGIWFAVMGIFPCLTLNITWLLNNQGGETKRGIGLAIIAILGQCSSFLSSTLYPKTNAPYFVKGCATGCALTFMITLLSLGLHFKLQHENRKRDREFGPVEDGEQLDVTQMGNKHPKFRYLA